MPFFMSRWVYKDDEVRALILKPQERHEVAASAIEAFGGKLHQFYYAFGTFDGVGISEFPDNETAMACFMTFSGGGGLKAFETTVLLTSDEARSAMEKARSVTTKYQPPSSTT